MSTATAPPARASVSLLGTIHAVLVSPRAWFSNLEVRSTTGAVGIALLVHLVTSPIMELGMMLLGEPVPPGKITSSFFTGPLSGLIAIYLPALIVYLLANLGQQAKQPFGIVVRCLAYAQIPVLIGMLPALGPLIAIVWCIWLNAFAFKHALRRTWLAACLLALAGPVLLMLFGLGLRTTKEAFKIPSPGMSPTLLIGDHIFVTKTAYGWLTPRVPDRGDLIVHRFPERPEQDFVKRVIGLPGDRILVKGTSVTINGWPIPTCPAGPVAVPGEGADRNGQLAVEFLDGQAYVVFHDATMLPAKSAFPELNEGVQGPYEVPAGQVFVMGDNRENSYDSRLWFEGKGGGVPIDFVKGRASSIWMSFAPVGIRWSRVGTDLMAAPSCPEFVTVETCAGIKRCLEGRPARAATVPPSPKG